MVLFAAVVDRGLRPQRPSDPTIVAQGLDDSLWTLVEDCWTQDPKHRPDVTAVALRLKTSNQGHQANDTTGDEHPRRNSMGISLDDHGVNPSWGSPQ
jgi:hypothetical protein